MAYGNRNSSYTVMRLQAKFVIDAASVIVTPQEIPHTCPKSLIVPPVLLQQAAQNACARTVVCPQGQRIDL